jgi:hypothetical protein
MDFNPTTWGSIGQWVSAALTTLAFLTTAYVVQRDTKERRLSQARQVAYFLKEEKRAVYERGRNQILEYTVRNLSPEPIYEVSTVFDSIDGIALSDYRAILLPGDTHALEVSSLHKLPPPVLSFRDNAGKVWKRSVSGNLHLARTRKNWYGKRPPKGFNPNV